MSSYAKPDFWADKAQKEGYPARSVYKLSEIQEKFKIFSSGSRVLDIGCAPGSWSLYVIKTLKGSGFVAGVDLTAVTMNTPYPNCKFIQGDLYDVKVRAELESLGPYDLVMSDAAPNTTGNRSVDQSRSHAIVEEVIAYSDTALKQGGNLVIKIFQGGDEKALIDMIRERFESARGFKPKACRAESFETYLIGLKKK